MPRRSTRRSSQWFEQGFGEGWIVNGGAELQPPSTATTVQARRRRSGRDRRSVRRAQGGRRRVLGHRGGRPGRGARDREDLAAPGAARAPASRSGRPSTTRTCSGTVPGRRRRPPRGDAARGGRSRRRVADPTVRLRRRRGGHADRARRGARRAGAPTGRRTGPARGCSGPRTATPSTWSGPPDVATPWRTKAPPPSEPSSGTDDRLALLFGCCHPALAPEVRLRAHAARGHRADHRPGRPGVPGATRRRSPPASPGPRRRSWPAASR